MSALGAAQVVPVLASVFATALAAEPTVVYGGPKPSGDSPTEYLAVGWEPDGDGVVSDRGLSSMGNRWVDESGDVTCTLVVWSGDDDTAPLLARAGALFALLDAALLSNPALSGALIAGANDGSYARTLGQVRVRPESTTAGAVVRVAFTIHYSSLLIT